MIKSMEMMISALNAIELKKMELLKCTLLMDSLLINSMDHSLHMEVMEFSTSGTKTPNQDLKPLNKDLAQ